MAIDPRISLAVQTPNVGQAINIFENALMNSQTRDLRAQQEQRAQTLAPFQLQQAQQGVDANAQTLNQNRDSQRLQNLHVTGQRLKPLIESGDTAGAQKLLLDNISNIQTRIESGEDLDINESMETLAKLQSGDLQGVLGDINAVAGLVVGGKTTGTASQRDFQTFQELSLRAQETGDPVDALAAQQFGIQSGFGRPTAAQNQAQAISKAGELADIEVEKSARIEQEKSKLQGLSAAKKLAVTKSGKAFDKIANIDVALSNFDDAITAIDEGAKTGTIISKLPSFRKSSIELDNIQKSLGLDVIANTTFGALSESELQFALDKALPKNLAPQDLKVWLQAKKAAQLKLRDHISEAAQFLGTGENTIPDWLELQKARSIINQQDETVTETTVVTPDAVATDSTTQVSAGNADVPEAGDQGEIQVDANGNRARVFADGTFKELP